MFPSGKTTVKGSLTFNNSIAVYNANPEGFKANFKGGIADAANVSTENVVIESVKEGMF